MTVEALNARKEELKKQYDMTVANANALQGALQFCDSLIAELTQKEVAKTEEVNKAPKKA